MGLTEQWLIAFIEHFFQLMFIKASDSISPKDTDKKTPPQRVTVECAGETQTRSQAATAWHVQCCPETWASWKCSRKTPHPALGAGLVLSGCSDKSAQTGQPQTTKVDSLTVPEVSIRNPVHWAKSRGVRRTVLPPKAPGQNLVFASCSFWGLPALLSWCHITPVSASTVP